MLSLQDDAVSVREAAVDLLGRHMVSRQDLALTYFEVLATAVRDPGTSVRKRAVNIMWESCIKQPSFPEATQACVHILTRATDPEDSIQKLVSKVFHSLWFAPPALTGKLCDLMRTASSPDVSHVVKHTCDCTALLYLSTLGMSQCCTLGMLQLQCCCKHRRQIAGHR